MAHVMVWTQGRDQQFEGPGPSLSQQLSSRRSEPRLEQDGCGMAEQADGVNAHPKPLDSILESLVQQVLDAGSVGWRCQ